MVYFAIVAKTHVDLSKTKKDVYKYNNRDYNEVEGKRKKISLSPHNKNVKIWIKFNNNYFKVRKNEKKSINFLETFE